MVKGGNKRDKKELDGSFFLLFASTAAAANLRKPPERPKPPAPLPNNSGKTRTKAVPNNRPIRIIKSDIGRSTSRIARRTEIFEPRSEFRLESWLTQTQGQEEKQMTRMTKQKFWSDETRQRFRQRSSKLQSFRSNVLAILWPSNANVEPISYLSAPFQEEMKIRRKFRIRDFYNEWKV